MIGPGRYDNLAEDALARSGATAVVLVIVGAPAGPGISVKGELSALLGMPDVLESVAIQLRQDITDAAFGPPT